MLPVPGSKYAQASFERLKVIENTKQKNVPLEKCMFETPQFKFENVVPLLQA